jgi:hypothetical protein
MQSLDENFKTKLITFTNAIEKHLQRCKFDRFLSIELDLSSLFVPEELVEFKNDVFRKMVEKYFLNEGWSESFIENNNGVIEGFRSVGYRSEIPIYEKYGFYLHLTF